MTKEQVEEIRNFKLELDNLKARKAAIKQKIAEHRDSLTDNEILANKTDALEIKNASAK